MRDLLTGLAIILIVVLTTILVAPYFVDWNGQRSFLEARLAHALGQKVTIGGDIDLKLLPTPYLVLDQVVVGADEGPIKIGVHHLDLELSAAPLMHGEFDIVRARLEEPTIRLTLQQDRTLPALPAAPAFAADVRFDRIQVSDGTLAVADPQSGHTFVLDHVDLDADAGSFSGPFKVVGTAGAAGRRTGFRLATATPLKGQAHVRLLVDETPAHPGLDLDGAVRLQETGGDAVRQSFGGTVRVSGRLPALSEEGPVTWTLSGRLDADAARADLAAGELVLGGDKGALTFQAAGGADYAAAPKLDLALGAKQLDIDRLAGAPVDAVAPPQPVWPGFAALTRFIAAATPPVATHVRLAVDNATWGSEQLSGLEAEATLGTGQAEPFKIAGDGPGDAHVVLAGTISSAPNGTTPTFAGTVDLASESLPHTLAWVRNVDPTLPAWDDSLGVDRVAIEGHVRADATTIGGDDLSLTFGRSVMHGSLRLRTADREHPTRLAASLRAETLDVAALPGFAALRAASRGLDLDFNLDTRSLKVGRFGEGELATGRVALALSKSGAAFDLTRFHAEDLGGATVDATGHSDAGGGRLSGSLDATRMEATAALVRQLLPGAPAQAFVARAAALAPARLRFRAAMSGSSDGTSGEGAAPRTDVSVSGSLGETELTATAKPDPANADRMTIAATVRSPDGTALLRQLGAATLPIGTLGAAQATLAADGSAGEPFDTTLDATLGASRLHVAGQFDLRSLAPQGRGRVHLASSDIGPLLQTVAVAYSDLTGRLPASGDATLAVNGSGVDLGGIKGQVAGTTVSGAVGWRAATGDAPALTGELTLDRAALGDLLGLTLGPSQPVDGGALWSRQPLAVGLIDPPAADLKLTMRSFGLFGGMDGQDAALDLRIGRNLVALDGLHATLGGGRLGGDVTLRRDGRQATVEGKVSLDKVAVRLPALTATLTGTLDLAGSGGSAAALVGSLAGSGTATAADLDLRGADPAALPKVFADVESDVLAVDQDSVVRALSESGGAPLAMGTRFFGLGLAAGVLHIDPKDAAPMASGGVTSTASAALDANTMRLDTHVEQTLHALPKTWSGPPPAIAVSLAGLVTKAPARRYDVSGFLDTVAARALARETARIEAYENDIRERAFFNERLQSEQRREADRQKAEDDARKAEAARQARAEAARQARIRAEQAKAAQDRAGQAPDGAAPDEATPDHAGAPPASPRRPAAPAGPPPDPSTLGRY